MHIKLWFTSLLCLFPFFASCKKSTYEMMNKDSFQVSEETPVTIFLHGTLPPVAGDLIHTLEIPLGLHKAETIKNRFIMGHIPFIMSAIDSQMFPLSTFYIFGWSGDLNFKARKEAARELYQAIKALNLKGPITLIGHSHGCNVILNLAAIVQEYNNTSFIIDRAILLAGPVQCATAVFIQSDIFKKIVSFYSQADLIQVLDPQGLYEECKELKNVTLFSQHLFSHHEKLIQVQVKKGKRGILHIEFVTKPFIQALPKILKLLEHKTHEYSGIYNFIINLKNLDLVGKAKEKTIL